MEIWQRREDETEKSFAAFKVYLQERSCQKVADLLSKSRQQITRWASQYDWKNRAIAYDNSQLEEARQQIKSRWTDFLIKQYRLNEKILSKIEKAIGAKEFDKSGLKSLNEMKSAAFSEQLAILDKLKINDAPQDNKLEIKIISADEQT